MKKILVTTAVLLAMTTAAFASEDVSPWNCPANLDGKVEEIGNQIEKFLSKKQLESAAQLASNCSTFGSSIDVSLVGPILMAYSEKAAKLPTAVKNIRKDMINRCIKKGEAEGGTLGRAVSVHCQLKVELAIDSAYGKN